MSLLRLQKYLLCASIAMAVTIPASARYRPAGGTAIKGRYIVVLKNVVPDRVRTVAVELARLHGGTAFAPMEHALRGFGMVMSEEQARRLSRHPLVELVEEDEWLRTSNEQRVLIFALNQRLCD